MAAATSFHPVVLVPPSGVQLLNSLRPPSAAEIEQRKAADEQQARRRAFGGGLGFVTMAAATSVVVIGLPSVAAKLVFGVLGLLVLSTIAAAASGRLDSVRR